MNIRLLLTLIVAMAMTVPAFETFAHDGVHKTSPSPFTECKYTVESSSENERGRSHHHHHYTKERCWLTDETYVILGLGAALAVVLALAHNHRRYYETENSRSFSFMPEPTIDIQKKQLGLQFSLNW